MPPILILEADAGLDLAPLTQKLWAERIPHRVVMNESGRQCLLLADAADVPRVQEWLQHWQQGDIQQRPAQPVQPGSLPLWLTVFATPVSSLILLGLVVFFGWMQFSPHWHSWLQAGAEFWPQQRFSWQPYATLGLWELWRPVLLHFSLVHLLFNGLWWWILARRVEQLDGWLALLALLLLCGWLGNAIQWWYAGPAFGGLSGVTMGLLGWVGIRLRRVPYALPAMLLPVMVGWLLLTLGADTLVPGLSGTAHGAHFGGLITGMLLGLIWPVATQFTSSARGSHDT